MTTSSHIDRQTFLDNLRKSGLLGRRDLQAAETRLPETDRGRTVARAFIEWGLLTKFQAELLLAGRTSGFILGQYVILDQIGQGGIGRVYRAMHRTMRRVVALKLLAPQFVNTEKARQLFKREVLAAARLTHANIITAYDANKIDGRYYLVMEYVDGPNLSQLVQQRNALPVGLACEIVRQVAAGLQYAFEQGMVHRDIKPANILVQRSSLASQSSTPIVKILDFGLARLYEPSQDRQPAKNTILLEDRTVMGTPDYLSPEQSRDLHSTDIRSDLYSLGCTLYYLVTARVPFPGGTSVEKLVRQANQEPTPVEDLRPDLPAGVAQIIHKLMAKSPQARFQTPAELMGALAPFATTAGLTAVAPMPATAAALAAAGPGSDNSNIDLGVNLGDELSRALEGTWPPDFSPTPIPADTAAALPPTAGLRHRAFFWVTGIVASLVALITFLVALNW